jgi:hypothetical protein
MEKSKILSGIVKHCEDFGFDPVTDGEFPVLYSFGIELSVSSIISGSIN